VRSSEIKIAVIGDVHDQWDSWDEPALHRLGVDLVLFVGDFGNESVEVVRSIAQLTLPKAVVFGNHDAWYTATDWGRQRSPYNHAHEDRVQQQLDLLGIAHVGYGQLDFPNLRLSVVGSRPFSWGGAEWKNDAFYKERFGISNFAESADRIVTSAQRTAYETVLFVGHNGPSGLGDLPEDPCGKDWQPIGGDHGDPDFELAIARTQQLGKTVPLVTFGHMHHSLRHTKQHQRRSVHRLHSTGTVYLNAACTPRIRHIEGDILRNFSLVTLRSGQVEDITLVWLNQTLAVVSSHILYQHQAATPALC
jgi:uncharacterized protein (TIGR04168 family)